MQKNMYKIEILDQRYNRAKLTGNQEELIIEGLENIGKTFTGDDVQLVENKVKVINSNIHNVKILGVLEFYSKYRFPANKRGIERYKFKPISPKYPCFLVASKMKRKYKENILVTIKSMSWSAKLPYGEIVDTLGPISIFENISKSNRKH